MLTRKAKYDTIEETKGVVLGLVQISGSQYEWKCLPIKKKKIHIIITSLVAHSPIVCLLVFVVP